jgi:hypothetical protein
MNPFDPLPSSLFTRPSRVVSAAKEARRAYRKLGLLGDDVAASVDVLDQYASALRHELGHGALSFRTTRRLRQLVPWLYGEQDRWEGLLPTLLDYLSSSSTRLPARTVAVLVEFFPSKRDQFEYRTVKEPPLILGVQQPLVQNLAGTVLRGGVALPDAISHLRLHSGSPVSRAVIEHLTSPVVAPWLWSHSREDLARFLDVHHGADGAGRVANALLEPLIPGIRHPSQVKQGTELGDLVGFLRGYLPGKVDGAAWSPVQPEVRKVFKWWKIQRDLEKAFLEWRAEPERRDFWWGYVSVIDEVEHFKRVGTVAIRIGSHWFVEVGQTGFATYGYTDEQWRRTDRRKCGRARHPTDVRPRRGYPVQRFTHHWGWQDKFRVAIYSLTGRRP